MDRAEELVWVWVAGAFGNESLTFPVGINYLLGNDEKNYFEIGVGYTYLDFGDINTQETSVFKTSFGNLTFVYRLAPC